MPQRVRDNSIRQNLDKSNVRSFLAIEDQQFEQLPLASARDEVLLDQFQDLLYILGQSRILI